ncbi:MAG: GNAT family N-acetyltransferase [Chitinophagaceae bacterium]
MSELFEIRKKAYLISTDKLKLNVQLIHHFLSTQSYWAENIPFNVLQKAIDNSLCFGVYFENSQIGFARTVTDKATFAYLADVFILSEYRNKGLGKWLLENIHAHPELQKNNWV